MLKRIALVMVGLLAIAVAILAIVGVPAPPVGRLLIIQGENDPRVPVTESRQIVDRLRELGREVWYAEFADEGHGVRLPLNAAYTAALGFTFARQCL